MSRNVFVDFLVTGVLIGWPLPLAALCQAEQDAVTKQVTLFEAPKLEDRCDFSSGKKEVFSYKTEFLGLSWTTAAKLVVDGPGYETNPNDGDKTLVYHLRAITPSEKKGLPIDYPSRRCPFANVQGPKSG